MFASGCTHEEANETDVSNVSKNLTNESAAGKSDMNIMQVLSDDRYVTLVELINASGLNGTLSTGGPYTVFVPTDKAFDALPTGAVEVLRNNTTELRRVLSYHVTNGEVTEQDLVNITSIQTLEGVILPVNNTNEGLYFGDAKITDTDTRPSNGIIHQIDTVLTPPK